MVYQSGRRDEMLGLSISRTANASAELHLQRERDGTFEAEFTLQCRHFPVHIPNLFQDCWGGVVRCSCACCSSTRTVCLVHQLELSLQSCAHFRPSFPGPRPETAKNWPSLQATWIWINAGFRTREGSARMPTQSVLHACSLWPWRSLGQRLFDR